MAGLEDLLGLGGYVDPNAGAPAAAPAPAGQPKGTWSDFLADPVNRAGLLSFGLQAMTGGWGNGTQQLGQALGAGAQGMAGTAKSMQEQGISNRDFAAKESEGAANRASHEKIATIGADSRAEVANIRGEYRAALAAATAKPQTSQEMTIYQKQFQSSMAELRRNQLTSRQTDDQIKQLADQEALMAVDHARKASGVRAQGAPLGTDGAAELGAPGSTLGAGQGQGTPGQTPNATSGTPKGADFTTLRAMPGFDEKMADPAWRKQLETSRPDLKQAIIYYDKEMMAKGARKKIWGMDN